MENFARYALYFFFYSAIGWFFESCYCSVRPRKWVNRGFLTGPLCPIYGTGALTFLLFVEPVRQIAMPFAAFGHSLSATPAAVFLVGLLLADIVEFTVSLLMEKLFHARWWDYTGNFLNIQGRICFKHSLYWGGASIIFLYFVHPFIDRYLGKLPLQWVFGALIAILVVFAVDVVDAIIKASDVRKLMDKLKKFGNMITDIFGNTIDDIVAVSVDEFAVMIDKASAYREEAQKQFEEIKENFERLSSGRPLGDKKKKNRMFKEFPMMRKSADERLQNIEKRIDVIKEKFKQNR